MILNSRTGAWRAPKRGKEPPAPASVVRLFLSSGSEERRTFLRQAAWTIAVAAGPAAIALGGYVWARAIYDRKSVKA